MDYIEQLEVQIVQQEKSILSATRAEILEESTAIVINCRYIAKLDVLLAFAKMAIEQHYVRPILNNGYISRSIAETLLDITEKTRLSYQPYFFFVV